MSRFLKHSLSSALAALALAGCAGLPGAPERPPEPEPVAAPAAADELMALLRRFIAVDAAERADIYFDAERRAGDEPVPLNRLRVALLQGWPGHAHSAPADAARTIDGLLTDDALDPDARDVARVLQFWIAQRGTDRRLQRSLEGRIAALERELAETREQLAALAALERMMDPELCNGDDDDCPQNRADPARR